MIELVFINHSAWNILITQIHIFIVTTNGITTISGGMGGKLSLPVYVVMNVCCIVQCMCMKIWNVYTHLNVCVCIVCSEHISLSLSKDEIFYCML